MEEMMTYSDIVNLGGKYKSTTPSNTSECPTKSEVESTFTNVTVGGGVASNELVSVTIYEFYWKNESSTQHNLLFNSLAQSGQITNLISTMNGKFLGYTASNALSWFHLTTSSTSTTMSYTVDANTLTNMREGTITLTLKDSGKQLKIHVRLEAKEIETSYNFYFTEDESKSKIVMMAADGGDLDVKITSETVPTGVQVPFTWRWSGTPVLPITTVTNTEDGVKITGILSNSTGYIQEYVLTFTQQTTNEQITLTIKQGTGPAYTNEYKFFFKGKDDDVTDYELGTLSTGSTTHIDIVSCQLQESTWVARKPIILNGSDFSAGNVVTIEESAGNPKQEGNMYYYGYDIKVGSDIHQGMQNQTITFRQTETSGILRVKFNL